MSASHASGGLAHSDRDLLVKALAPGADPDNARGVLADALDQLRLEVGITLTATEAGSDGEAWSLDVESMLAGLLERIAAFQGFTQRYFEVEFRKGAAAPSPGGAS